MDKREREHTERFRGSIHLGLRDVYTSPCSAGAMGLKRKEAPPRAASRRVCPTREARSLVEQPVAWSSPQQPVKKDAHAPRSLVV